MPVKKQSCYMAWVKCLNCYHEDTIEVPYGTPIDHTECPACGCRGYLVNNFKRDIPCLEGLRKGNEVLEEIYGMKVYA